MANDTTEREIRKERRESTIVVIVFMYWCIMTALYALNAGEMVHDV
jgi:hypothetical protein